MLAFLQCVLMLRSTAQARHRKLGVNIGVQVKKRGARVDPRATPQRKVEVSTFNVTHRYRSTTAVAIIYTPSLRHNNDTAHQAFEGRTADAVAALKHSNHMLSS